MGQGYVSIPCTKSNPCELCGRTDYCYVGDYGTNKVRFCVTHRSPEVTAGGQLFHLTKITEGNYSAYIDDEYRQKSRREWMEEQRRSNPNWVERGYQKRPKMKPVADIPKKKEYVTIDEIAPLSNKLLHEVYSYLLDLLYLEPEHKTALLDEWNAGIENKLGEKILKQWPIRSLPMNDVARKNANIKLHNRTREDIVVQLVSRFRSLRGVPGFYLETRQYKDQSGKTYTQTRWQMVSLSGIVFPEYDSKGYIYRLRIGDEHPVLEEYEKDDFGNYIYYTNAKNEQKHSICATYTWNYRTGEWFRNPKNGHGEIVWSKQKGIFKVTLNKKGYPVIDGKVNGKYKNFSSRKDETRETADEYQVFNAYPEGTRSGSNTSLYCKDGDDFRFVYITEGEKKAMVMNMLLNCPVISIPGVNTYGKIFENEYGSERSMFDFLLSKGMQCIIIVFDADKAVNDAVLASEAGAVQRCLEHGVMTCVGEWNLAFGKGADDVLIQGNRFKYVQKK